VLLESPGVKTAAVIVHRDDPRDPATAKLCAYVVLQEGNISEVRRHASRVLPDYMVPSALMEVPLLPLTSNGKLDVKRLPVPDKHACRHHDSNAVRNHGQTGNALTTALLQIWEEVLGVPVSLDDNFFDLGGNSLYAMRIATAMRNQGLPPLPVRELYARQTVRRLGEQLNAPLT
jgi:Phosphopantetheine attachment site/AMP-binding enzyme C-terminal domain